MMVHFQDTSISLDFLYFIALLARDGCDWPENKEAGRERLDHVGMAHRPASFCMEPLSMFYFSSGKCLCNDQAHM